MTRQLHALLTGTMRRSLPNYPSALFRFFLPCILVPRLMRPTFGILETTDRRTRTLRLLAFVPMLVLWSQVPIFGATFMGLGDLAGGEFFTRPWAVSADGKVVVGEGNSALGTEAFRWEAGVIEGLGDLAEGEFGSVASGVSADGSVVVGRGNSADGFEAFRWTAASGVMEGLGDLAGGIFFSQAQDVSDDGSVVVGVSNGDPLIPFVTGEAFRWTADGGMEFLGDLAGGELASRADGISADGAVIVGTSDSADGVEAFRWTADGGMEGLGDLDGGGFSSKGLAVSADGAVVVGEGLTADSFPAFRWTAAGGMENIGTLPDGLGLLDAFPRGVSGDGAIVVGASEGKAFIWDATNGMRALKEVLETDFGLDLTGWTLQGASDITPNGLTIVGTGFNPDGEFEGWIVTIPEPATAWLLVLGVLCFASKSATRCL